jgi:hypothetical protein
MAAMTEMGLDILQTYRSFENLLHEKNLWAKGIRLRAKGLDFPLAFCP